MAVAGLVLGIFGIILSWFPAALLGVPLALVGLILGILARKNAQETQQPTGMATAGLVVSIVGLTLGILVSAACFACYKNVERQMQDPAVQKQNKDFNDALRKAIEESQKQQPQPQQQQQLPPPTPPTEAPAKK